jgi:hypothetical protein
MFKNPTAHLNLVHCLVTSGTGWRQQTQNCARTGQQRHPVQALSFSNNCYKQMASFIICWRFHKVAKSDCQLRQARVQQLGYHWTGFHEISYLSIIRKSVEKTEVSLKSDKNSRHFT